MFCRFHTELNYYAREIVQVTDRGGQTDKHAYWAIFTQIWYASTYFVIITGHPVIHTATFVSWTHHFRRLPRVKVSFSEIEMEAVVSREKVFRKTLLITFIGPFYGLWECTKHLYIGFLLISTINIQRECILEQTFAKVPSQFTN